MRGCRTLLALSTMSLRKISQGASFEPLSKEWIEEKFGPLADKISRENENDAQASSQNIVDNWDKIREIIAEIPSYEELISSLRT